MTKKVFVAIQNIKIPNTQFRGWYYNLLLNNGNFFIQILLVAFLLYMINRGNKMQSNNYIQGQNKIGML